MPLLSPTLLRFAKHQRKRRGLRRRFLRRCCHRLSWNRQFDHLLRQTLVQQTSGGVPIETGIELFLYQPAFGNYSRGACQEGRLKNLTADFGIAPINKSAQVQLALILI